MMATPLPPSSTDTTTPTILPGCKELLSFGQFSRQVRIICRYDSKEKLSHSPRPTSIHSRTHHHIHTSIQNRRPSLANDFSQSHTDLIRRSTRQQKPYDSASPPRREKSFAGQRSRKRKDTFDREEQRKAKLENDPWSDKTRLTPKSVFCLGCKRVIRLDRRNDYYPGLWVKHRDLCQGIAKAKREANEKQKKERISQVKPSIDDEEAAKILVEMMIKNRCFL